VEATFYLKGIAEPGPHFSVLVSRSSLPGTSSAASQLERVPPAKDLPIAEVTPTVLPAPHTSHYRRPKRQWVWAAFASIVAVVAYFAMRPLATTAHQPERVSLGLQAYNIAGRQVRIEWNRQAEPIRTAKSGTLEIADGTSRYALPLSAEQLQSSSLTYGRQSDTISIALRLPGGIKESVQVLSRDVPTPIEGATTIIPPSNTPSTQPPAQPAAGNSSLLGGPPNAERRAPLKRFELNLNEPPARRDVPLPEPPATNAPVPKTPPTLPVPLSNDMPPRPARSGRVIWTGSLGRRGVVEFEGSAATLGSLSGALPGVAGKIAVYPAEFASDGLTVYVTDASRHNRTEAPSPQTGWNKLHFVWDPERVKQLTVLEAPGANNQYSRMALRSDARTCSVIVVEWSIP
jgi:hypothetical protein